MTASFSSSWHRFESMGRAYWLPPGGIGNGLRAQTWAVLVDADASILILLLDSLREADIPAHAVQLDTLGRRAPASVFPHLGGYLDTRPRRGCRPGGAAAVPATDPAMSPSGQP
jgi:hypothetical protein